MTTSRKRVKSMELRKKSKQSCESLLKMNDLDPVEIYGNALQIHTYMGICGDRNRWNVNTEAILLFPAEDLSLGA